MVDIKHPFRLAAWKATRLIFPDSEKKYERNILMIAITGSIVATTGLINISNTTPNNTEIAGQNERIEQYEASLNFIQNQKTLLEQKKDVWEMSTLPGAKATDTDSLATEIKTIDTEYQKNIMAFLTRTHIEDQVSEVKIDNLLNKFETTIMDTDKFSTAFADMGDTAYLRECQLEQPLGKDATKPQDRAVQIASCANNKDSDEAVLYMLSALGGTIGGGLGSLLLFISLAAPFESKIKELKRKPRPKPNQRQIKGNH